MENKSVRNGTVDFLKFLFCVVIMLRHSEYALPQGTFDFLWRGAICVEFFFLVSGYLMACSAKRRLQASKLDGIGNETVAFMRRKIAILLPTLPLAVLISFVVTEISKQTTGVLEWFRAFILMLWDLLILPAAGFGNLNERWYIGCMLLVMFVFYPVMLKSFNVFIRIIAPLTAIFVLGYIYKNYGELVNPQLYLGHMYKGMLRAIGEIALGAAIYPLIEWLKKLRLTPFLKILVTVTELLCVFIAIFLMFKVRRKDYDFFIMLIMALLVALAFSRQGFFAKYMDNKFNYSLGSISLTMYLSHLWISQALGRYYHRFAEAGLYGLGADKFADRRTMLLIYIVLAVIMTAIIYALSKALKKIGKHIDCRIREKYLPIG